MQISTKTSRQLPAMSHHLAARLKSIFYCLCLVLLALFSSTESSAQTCTVNAGVPFVMCQGEASQWTLYGNTNDPGGGTVPITWSVVSQPAGSSVNIASTNSLTTDVTGVNVIGSYIFKIEGVCPDGSGTPFDEVTYELAAPLPDPNLDPSYIFCTEGSISVPSPDPSVSYGWLAIEFDENLEYEYGVNFSADTTTFSMDVNRYYPGGEGKVVLFSTRNGCTRTDTVDLIMMNDEAADAGADVYICGDTWVKHPWIEEQLEADEYRFLTRGGSMQWNQLSGPGTATIDYQSTYTNYSDGFTTWTGLTPGTYEFELVFTYPPPCNTVTRDTVAFYANAGVSDDCQNFSTGRVFVGDCYGDLDSWIIDLKNYGIDPAMILPGDSIIWSLEGPECSFPLPAVNQMIVEVPTDGICEDCELHAYYQCNSAPGCGDAIEFEFFVFDAEYEYSDIYACTPDGDPVTVGMNAPIGGSSTANCNGNSNFTYTEVVSSPLFAAGTRLSGLLGNIPFPIGQHDFEYNVTAQNHYLQLTESAGSTGCQQSYPFSVIVAGIATAANAGTDAILPCNQTTTTLSGSDPNVPTFTGSTFMWYFVDGPTVPTISDPAQLDLNVSNMVSGIYTFKYSVGNVGCGFFEDEVSIVVADSAPGPVSAGPDQTSCYGGKIYLDATIGPDDMGTWTSVPGGLTFGDIHDPNTYIEGMAPGTNYTLTWTAENGCGDNSDSVIINVTNSDGGYADAGPDVCVLSFGSGSLANLTANTPIPGAIGTWSIVGSSPATTAGTFSDINSPNSTFWGGGGSNNNFWLEWSVIAPGCDIQRDTMMVTFKSYYKNPLDDLYSFCGGPGTYTLDYENFWYGHYLWDENYEGPAGVEFLTPLNEEPATISFQEPGAYLFYINNGSDACGEPAEITVYVTEEVPAVDAGPDEILCDVYDIELDAGSPPNGGYWIASVESMTNAYGDVSWSDNTDPGATVTVPFAGDWSFVWVAIPDEAYGSNCLATDTVNIFIVPPATVEPVETYCVTSAVTLRGNHPGEYGTGSWTFVSGPSTPTQTALSSAGDVAVYDNFAASGTYIFEYSITSPHCPTTTQQMSVVFEDPMPQLPDDMLICNDSLVINGPVFPPTMSVEWTILSGSGSIIGSNSGQDLEIGSLINGETITIEIAVTTASGCTGRDQMNIAVEYVDPLSIVATDITVCGGGDGAVEINGMLTNTTYTLNYTFNGMEQGPIGVTSDAFGRYILDNLGPGEYGDIIITNAAGCQSEVLGPAILEDVCTQNLGDFVWFDDDNNGQQDSGESGVANVIVSLYEDTDQDGVPDGPPVSNTTTASNGYYLFPNIDAGSYIVGFNISPVPGPYGFTQQDNGSDISDSDVNAAGLTGTIILADGIDNMTVDAGIHESCVNNDCILIQAVKN